MNFSTQCFKEKLSFPRLVAVLMVLSCLADRLQAQCPTLVWSDEFSGATLDLNKWTPMIGDGCDIGVCGWGNNELQWYKAENATVSNGTLKITAKAERVRGKKYTSARLNTKNKGDWAYGRFEARLKLPYGQGIWPAFWMLSTNEPYGGWPASGEIDIMELVGHEPDLTHGTIHYGPDFSQHQFQGGSYRLHSGIFNDDFHEFAIEWEAGEIRWYVDDYLFLTKTSANAAPFNWPFDHDFHFLLNVAVGGNWPGSPDNTTIFPQVMEVDYVRVYEGYFPALTGKRKVAHQAAGEVYTVENPPAGASFTWSVPAGATIVSGQGTNSVTVNWGTAGGSLSVVVNSSCWSEQIDLAVLVEPPYLPDRVFENFDDPATITYNFSTGALAQDVANPSPQGVNTSALSGRYTRNASSQYDVLEYLVSSLGDASQYQVGQKKFYIDVYTDAPPGTLVLLQLESGALATANNYPTGRHSRYEAYTTAQNQWERLELTYLDSPDPGTPDNGVDKFIFLFASNSFTGHTFYFDNFASFVADGGQGSNTPPTVTITSPANGTIYNQLSSITISATASDSDGSVQGVTFFVNGNSIGADASSPYSINWTIPADGAYTLTAIATDNEDATTTSAPVSITADTGGSGPTYCNSQGNNAGNEWIASVSIGGFSNSSGKAGYSDFTGTVATLGTGSHAVALTPGYQGPSRNEYWRIWADFNADGDFVDAGELIFDSGSAQPGAVTGSLTIPGAAAGTATRMRIAMKRDAAPGPCESFPRGEVEDYTLSVPTASAVADPGRVQRHDIMADKQSSTAGIQLFPNPAREVLQLKNGSATDYQELIIYDRDGRVVLRNQTILEKGSTIIVPLDQLPKGIYLIRLYGRDEVSEGMRFVRF